MSATPMDVAPRLPVELARTCHRRDSWRHWLRLGWFIFLYAAAAVGAVYASQRVTAAWQWLLLLPLYLVAAASLHGISLFTHEAVHGTLSANRFWNDVLGAACAIPVLQNCSAYRVLHLRHHNHLGEEGDPDHYSNYTRWSWLVFGMNWARLLVGYPVYITMIPILGFKHGTAKDRRGIVLEVAATVLLIALVIASPLPGAWIWQAWGIPMLFINTFVNIRGMSQHTLLEHSDDEIRGTRSILTTPLVRFFMCNENYHLEHHLYPGVPWHHLPEVHQALKGELEERGAPYIASYSAFVREFVRHSLKRCPLGWRGTSR
ncbi:MAG: fatty acid desaturase [Luteolibacter sp.]